MQIDFLNAKVGDAHQALKEALTTTDVTYQDQKDTIKRLEKSVEEQTAAKNELTKANTKLEAEKVAAEEKVVHEKKVVEEARRATEEAKKAVSSLEETKKDLESRVDTLQARLTLSEDTLAKERDDIQKKIDEAEDKAIGLAWYRLWVNNPYLNLSFLEGEHDKTLATWKARLIEEDELMTYRKATARGDEDGDVSSKALSKSQAVLDAEIEAILNEDVDEVGSANENETPLPDEQATGNVEDAPPPSQS